MNTPGNVSGGGKSSSTTEQEETKQLADCRDPIEEEGSSGSSSDEKNKMPENPTHPSKNSHGSNKKHGLLNKMRRGLKKLTITKTTSEDKNYEPASMDLNE